MPKNSIMSRNTLYVSFSNKQGKKLLIWCDLLCIDMVGYDWYLGINCWKNMQIVFLHMSLKILPFFFTFYRFKKKGGEGEIHKMKNKKFSSVDRMQCKKKYKNWNELAVMRWDIVCSYNH